MQMRPRSSRDSSFFPKHAASRIPGTYKLPFLSVVYHLRNVFRTQGLRIHFLESALEIPGPVPRHFPISCQRDACFLSWDCCLPRPSKNSLNQNTSDALSLIVRDGAYLSNVKGCIHGHGGDKTYWPAAVVCDVNSSVRYPGFKLLCRHLVAGESSELGDSAEDRHSVKFDCRKCRQVFFRGSSKCILPSGSARAHS
jgi:hypothetical protein